MNIQSSANSLSSMSKTAQPKAKVEPKESKHALVQMEDFVTSPVGASISHGLGGMVPGVGAFTSIHSALKIDGSSAYFKAPTVSKALKYATMGAGIANGVMTFGLLMEAMEPRMSATLGAFKLTAFAASGITGALSAYVAASDLN